MTSKNECEYCGASLGEGERYCKYCGSPNPSYKCPTKNVPQIVKTELPAENKKDNNKLTGKKRLIFILVLVIIGIIIFLARHSYVWWLR